MKVNRVKRGKGAFIIGIAWKTAVILCLASAAAGTYGYLAMHPFPSLMPIKHIAFQGNRHLTDDELKAFMDQSGVAPPPPPEAPAMAMSGDASQTESSSSASSSQKQIDLLKLMLEQLAQLSKDGETATTSASLLNVTA